MMMMMMMILTLMMIRVADTDLLHASGLIEQMKELTRDLIKKYKIYGDGVFPNVGNIVSKHVGNTSREYFNCYSRCLLEALKMKTENVLREELCYSSDI